MQQKKKEKTLSTHRIVMAGVMGAICIVLGMTGLGMIPIPNLTGRATILHVPVIIAAILEGPVVGGLTGLIMGLYSFLTPTGAVPADPIVRILPRICIGIFSALAFKLCGKHFKVGAVFAGVVGTLTNTVGYIGLAVLLGYLPAAIWITIIPQFIAEMVLAAVLTYLVVRVLLRAEPYRFDRNNKK